jgi:hypothetical protein
MTVAQEWAIELGLTSRKVRHSESSHTFDGGGAFPPTFDVVDDLWETAFDAVGVWAPSSLRWFSFAASLGVAKVKAKHTVNPDPSFAPPGATPVTEGWTGSAPHLGIEARFDYPVWRGLALGLRLGVDAAKVSDGQTIPRNPWAATPTERIQWLEAGWITCVPFDLSLRYVF